MRVEPFCRVSMRYRASSWHRPYSGEEGLGDPNNHRVERLAQETALSGG